MDTPTRMAIRETLNEVPAMTAAEIKARTRLNTVMLYGTLLQMEDDGEIVSTLDPERPSQRRYLLARLQAA